MSQLAKKSFYESFIGFSFVGLMLTKFRMISKNKNGVYKKTLFSPVELVEKNLIPDLKHISCLNFHVTFIKKFRSLVRESEYDKKNILIGKIKCELYQLERMKFEYKSTFVNNVLTEIVIDLKRIAKDGHIQSDESLFVLSFQEAIT